MPYEEEVTPRLIEVSPAVAEVLDRLSHLLGVSHSDLIHEAIIGNTFEDASNGDLGSFIEIGDWFALPPADLQAAAIRASEYFETRLSVYDLGGFADPSGIPPRFTIDRTASPGYPANHGTRLV